MHWAGWRYSSCSKASLLQIRANGCSSLNWREKNQWRFFSSRRLAFAELVRFPVLWMDVHLQRLTTSPFVGWAFFGGWLLFAIEDLNCYNFSWKISLFLIIWRNNSPLSETGKWQRRWEEDTADSLTFVFLAISITRPCVFLGSLSCLYFENHGAFALLPLCEQSWY